MSDIDDMYEHCYECSGYGDDYVLNKDGELECCCNDCPFNPINYDEW